MASDWQLLCTSQDARAFAATILRRYSVNCLDADDLINEAYLRLHRKFSDSKPQPKCAKAYVWATMKSVALDYIRKRNRIKYTHSPELVSEVDEDTNEISLLDDLSDAIRHSDLCDSDKAKARFVIERARGEISQEDYRDQIGCTLRTAQRHHLEGSSILASLLEESSAHDSRRNDASQTSRPRLDRIFEAVRNRIKYQNKTQVELASELGLSQSCVSRILRDPRRYRDRVNEIAEHLGVVNKVAPSVPGTLLILSTSRDHRIARFLRGTFVSATGVPRARVRHIDVETLHSCAKKPVAGRFDLQGQNILGECDHLCVLIGRQSSEVKSLLRLALGRLQAKKPVTIFLSNETKSEQIPGRLQSVAFNAKGAEQLWKFSHSVSSRCFGVDVDRSFAAAPGYWQRLFERLQRWKQTDTTTDRWYTPIYMRSATRHWRVAMGPSRVNTAGSTERTTGEPLIVAAKQNRGLARTEGTRFSIPCSAHASNARSQWIITLALPSAMERARVLKARPDDVLAPPLQRLHASNGNACSILTSPIFNFGFVRSSQHTSPADASRCLGTFAGHCLPLPLTQESNSSVTYAGIARSTCWAKNCRLLIPALTVLVNLDEVRCDILSQESTFLNLIDPESPEFVSRLYGFLDNSRRRHVPFAKISNWWIGALRTSEHSLPEETIFPVADSIPRDLTSDIVSSDAFVRRVKGPRVRSPAASMAHAYKSTQTNTSVLTTKRGS